MAPISLLHARITRPEELLASDELGYFVFIGVIGGKYKFYEKVGLNHVTLHWQTVNHLINTLGATRPNTDTNPELLNATFTLTKIR
jgi:hypothetical protein